jgi:membrane protein involved in colicin uptake
VTAPRSDPTGKKLTKQEISILYKNHEQAEERCQKEHKETQDLLNKIQRDEIKSTKGLGRKRTIEEVQATLTAEELERKDKNKARIESARKEAAADRERTTLMLEVLKESVKTLKFTKHVHGAPALGCISVNKKNPVNGR